MADKAPVIIYNRGENIVLSALQPIHPQSDPTSAFGPPAVLPDGNGGYTPCPVLLTEDEVIRLLRIPQVSKSGNHGNVIANLKRIHGLPCIHIFKQPLYPRDAVLKWIEEKLQKEMM